jgi:PAS domain S-box-containing protein
MGHVDRRLSRHSVVLGIALVLFVGVFVLRMALPEKDEPLLLLELIPVALVASAFGLRIGLLAGVLAVGAWYAYAEFWTGKVLDPADVISRVPVFLVPAVFIGWLADHDRSARAALTQSASDFRLLAEESSDTISTHSSDGDYTFVSGRCREMLGYEPEELLGTSPYEYVHPDDLEAMQHKHAELLRTPETITVTFRSRRKDGPYIWFESRMRTLRNPKTGEVAEIHSTTHEVSEREQEHAVTAQSRREARARIEGVLSGEGLAIVYQPIVDLDSGRTIGVEALSRFGATPTRTPNLWFDEAWDVGLGQALELEAIGVALKGAAALPDEWSIALNASPQTVLAPQLLDRLGTAADRVIIEVTEHAEIADLSAFRHAADLLRMHGVRLAIDDAGSGHSGLQRLLDLSPDILKLDLSLTREIDGDPRRRALASALIAFGKSANVDVVAEGIETEDELKTLRDLGVGFGQGYHLGRPAPAEALELASRSPLASGAL